MNFIFPFPTVSVFFPIRVLCINIIAFPTFPGGKGEQREGGNGERGKVECVVMLRMVSVVGRKKE